MVQEEPPPPEDVHQADYEEVEQVAPEGPAEGQIRLADDSDGADPCAQFRQGCGGREEHHADERSAKPRLDGYHVGRLGQKQGSAEYYGGRNAKQYPENR